MNSDWSAAYTPNAGPMDAVIKVQLKPERSRSAQEYVHLIRMGVAKDPRFESLDFAFDAGGLVRGAMNEGKSTPINIRITGKNQAQARAIAERIRNQVIGINGVVDARIIQRLDYPEYVIDVDRAKAADLGLSQQDVMRNVVAAFNSSIQFNKRNFWIDPVGGNQYFVGVQYPENGHQVAPDAARHPDHQLGAEEVDPAEQPRHAEAGLGADRGDAHQYPADDRPDDGHLRARPRARLR